MTLASWLAEHQFGDGVISVCKPYGMPSTAIVELYKRATHEKAGHGGTLDPLAEGKMVLGLGKGTKKLTNYLTAEKRYSAQILFGASTDSGDLELPLNLASNCLVFNKDQFITVLEKFSLGFIQTISKYSAVKVNGKSQFERAHKGEDVVEKCSDTKLLKYKITSFAQIDTLAVMKLLEIKKERLAETLANFDEIGNAVGYFVGGYRKLFEKWENSLNNSINMLGTTAKDFVLSEIEVTVPKGTYIRSLAVSLAAELGTLAVLTGLERLDAGKIS